MSSTTTKSKVDLGIEDRAARAARFVLKLNPRKMMGNPVMFVVEVGSVITTILLVAMRCGIRVRSGSICRSRSGCGSP